MNPRHSEEHHSGMTDDHRIAMVHQPILGRNYYGWWIGIVGDFRGEKNNWFYLKVEESSLVMIRPFEFGKNVWNFRYKRNSDSNYIILLYSIEDSMG